ncbi:MAG: hypothetical protein N2234_04285 [Planctomycetota bacterium]|nr:hypothetical protein [Planctomycetota bacterium]
MKRMWVSLILLAGVFLFAQEAPRSGERTPSVTPPEDAIGDIEAEMGEIIKEIHRLKKMTSFLNLFNGLNLNTEQLEEIIKINEEYKAEVDALAEAAKERAKKCMEALKDWVSAIEKGEMPKDLMEKVGKADSLFKEMEKKVEDIRLKYRERLESVFTESQKEVINDFKPCVVPPQNLRNPVRVGQASNNEPIISELRRLRKIPQARFNEMLEKMIDGYIEKVTKKHRLEEVEISKERERIKALLVRIKGMSDVDFELNKEQLAEEVKYKDKGEIIREEMKRLQKELSEHEQKQKELSGNSPVMRWFLRPDKLPVLRMRLALLRGEPLPEECSGKQPDNK